MKRQSLIDALKVLASQLIVLHHLSAYGPVADALGQALEQTTEWLYQYGRMAVQVFLVLGGFLAARSLAPQGIYRGSAPLRQIALRYWRLAPPFVLAMAVAVASSTWARHWLQADFIPAPAQWSQVLWHVLLLHGLADAEALSAGVWYVAIDFQLYALLVLLLWAGGMHARRWVLLAMAAALVFFNRNTDLDDWAVYFFGSYGLGAAAYWAASSPRFMQRSTVFALVAVLALLLEFRTRIALALGVALLLAVMQRLQSHTAVVAEPHASPLSVAQHSLAGARTAGWVARAQGVLAVLGRASYALFLLHFSVLMLVNAAYAHSSLLQGLGLAWTVALYWCASMALALLFERWVERPLAR